MQQGNRNMSLVLGEIAERNYKQQYGLLIADDLNDVYEPYLKQQKDAVQLKCNAIRNTSSPIGSMSESSSPVSQKEHSLSCIATHKKRESLPEIGSSSSNSSFKFEDILEEEEDENIVINVETTKTKTTENIPAFSKPVVDDDDEDDDGDGDDDDGDGDGDGQTTYDSVISFKED